MRKLLRVLAIAAAAMAGAPTAMAQTAQSQVCHGKFALCTTAPCEPISGDSENYSCKCTVLSSYSLGGACPEEPQWNPDGSVKVMSRYYPIATYGLCKNTGAWANCLNASCTVDSNNPAQATCTCPKETTDNYILVTSKFNSNMCGRLFSSAPLQAAQAIAAYFQAHNPFPFSPPTPKELPSQ